MAANVYKRATVWCLLPWLNQGLEVPFLAAGLRPIVIPLQDIDYKVAKGRHWIEQVPLGL